MTNDEHDQDPAAAAAAAARVRLDRALAQLAVTFHGMTARADESNCDCHWGSPEELALLKLPGTELDPDLLHRTWSVPDWRDHGAVLRRILPQFARFLTGGLGDYAWDIDRVGYSFHRAEWWQQWPAPQSAAVDEFLHAWWARSLLTPDPALPVHELLQLCTEASGTIGPWLADWEALHHPIADQHLAHTVDAWERDLLGDSLPWTTWSFWPDEAEAVRTELTAWLVSRAPERLRAHGAPEQLLHAVRLLGLTDGDRWYDPHWPNHRYS
ncbi:hypothetical protein [Streptomyces sp. AP-93]|uniref:hypothetical protein n=1 Tax=Streptomyces sp. AP-93 TaxID=2929048 RepID=UPI001FAF7D19|nr:hypothetical protein [Streptomyces sp. AP-93]MCJ0873691.1 hypothetical protein [Streptomyces sp. AP-93]